MKDLSFFLLKNSLGAKMKKGLKSFCNGVGSTSTLNQQNKAAAAECEGGSSSSCMVDTSTNWNMESPPTLEEMILQLELEEEAAAATRRIAKLDDHVVLLDDDDDASNSKRRMSCVNNSDILRSARNALNQYPRFSVDGRDAMYRSSFRNLNLNLNLAASLACPGGGSCTSGRASVCCSNSNTTPTPTTSALGLPRTIAGESVFWSKPGVVAKLMGLEAMPVPVAVPLVVGSSNNGNGNLQYRKNNSNQKYFNPSSPGIIRKRESLILRRADQRRRQQLEKRKLGGGTDDAGTGTSGCRRLGRGGTGFPGSTIATSSCVMKPPIAQKGREGTRLL